MSGEPVIFKRTKSKPAQRSRVSTPDVEDGSVTPGETADVEESPSVLATKLKKKIKSREKPKSKLSFGADEEGDGEVFQVKKSSLSRKLTLGKHPAQNAIPSSVDLSSTTRSNGAPTYDAAYLNELKASTPTTRPSVSANVDMSYDADMSVDADALPQSSLTGVIDLSDPDGETAIPSGSSILAAKQKRERLRASGTSGGEDYISLSVTKRSDYSQGPHPESRLVREEDELGDADDEFAEYTSAQERIALGKKSRKVEARKKRDEMNEMIADAEEQDEESIEWEQEQLRRGGLQNEESIEKAPKPVYKPTPIPPVTPIPTLGAAVARLTQSLTALTTSHVQNSTSMASLGEERLQLEAREKEMREMIAKAEDKRGWFAAFREWVESVATFLDEKYPQVERLEDEHLSLLKERADMIAQRRKADDEDDLSVFLGTLPQPQTQEEVTDELGRVTSSIDVGVARRERVQARGARRMFRRANGRGQEQEEEGYSTDSSLSLSDAANYKSAKSQLAKDAKELMSDVKAEEFRNPSRGLGKWFGEWRSRFGDSYTGAWGGLGMVSAWEFWVRLEMLGWSPLEDSRTLDSYTWYHALYQHSRPRIGDEGNEDEEPEMGPDGDLVSAMISTVIIPRLCKLIEGGCFDPYSTRNVRALMDLVEQIEASVEKDGLKFEMILKSTLSIFQGAVTATDTILGPYLALNNPRFDPGAIPARRRILARRYKLLRNLLQWRKYTGERFGIGHLAQTLVESSMLPVAESGWEVGGEDYMRKAVHLLPKELVPTGLKVRLGLV
ncbi:uncharacterized protein FIBRA_00863 [Fibroporia radiculosa]|uniref:GCF C-terminal domain-containing protein n=1 Tax=Fibroporia radiculosa TaxID=599839 RepID=J4HSB6_9APHY|nr:uncharacterized protein FIBRA_00863 [Fibroporia radiculosa]CCL98857.1 predicted protein [Fibroporia radiculosa]